MKYLVKVSTLCVGIDINGRHIRRWRTLIKRHFGTKQKALSYLRLYSQFAEEKATLQRVR